MGAIIVRAGYPMTPHRAFLPRVTLQARTLSMDRPHLLLVLRAVYGIFFNAMVSTATKRITTTSTTSITTTTKSIMCASGEWRNS